MSFMRSCTTSKLLQNWKQFTTRKCDYLAIEKLYNIKVITELKAIHNPAIAAQIGGNGCTTSKLLQNWKQFTTTSWQYYTHPPLYNIKVITELKAIHNFNAKTQTRCQVVQHQSYYRIESNSQQRVDSAVNHYSCTTSKLLQNWKQFTTIVSAGVQK